MNCYRKVFPTTRHVTRISQTKHTLNEQKGDMRRDKQVSVSDVKQKKKGRPSKSTTTCTSTSLPICTRHHTFDKEMCAICQEETADNLHDVSTENMGAQLKAIGQQTANEQLKVRLSNVGASLDLLTAVAEDMKYHLLCLSHAKRDIETYKRRRDNSQKMILSSHS